MVLRLVWVSLYSFGWFLMAVSDRMVMDGSERWWKVHHGAWESVDTRVKVYRLLLREVL